MENWAFPSRLVWFQPLQVWLNSINIKTVTSAPPGWVVKYFTVYLNATTPNDKHLYTKLQTWLTELQTHILYYSILLCVFKRVSNQWGVQSMADWEENRVTKRLLLSGHALFSHPVRSVWGVIINEWKCPVFIIYQGTMKHVFTERFVLKIKFIKNKVIRHRWVSFKYPEEPSFLFFGNQKMVTLEENLCFRVWVSQRSLHLQRRDSPVHIACTLLVFGYWRADVGTHFSIRYESLGAL